MQRNLAPSSLSNHKTTKILSIILTLEKIPDTVLKYIVVAGKYSQTKTHIITNFTIL